MNIIKYFKSRRIVDKEYKFILDVVYYSIIWVYCPDIYVDETDSDELAFKFVYYTKLFRTIKDDIDYEMLSYVNVNLDRLYRKVRKKILKNYPNTKVPKKIPEGFSLYNLFDLSWDSYNVQKYSHGYSTFYRMQYSESRIALYDNKGERFNLYTRSHFYPDMTNVDFLERLRCDKEFCGEYYGDSYLYSREEKYIC